MILGATLSFRHQIPDIGIGRSEAKNNQRGIAEVSTGILGYDGQLDITSPLGMTEIVWNQDRTRQTNGPMKMIFCDCAEEVRLYSHKD